MLCETPDRLSDFPVVPVLPRGAAGRSLTGYEVPEGWLTGHVTREHRLWKTLVEIAACKKQRRVLLRELELEHDEELTTEDIPRCYRGITTIYAQLKGQPDIRYIPPSSGGLPDSEVARIYLQECHKAALAEEGRKRISFRGLPHYNEYLSFQPPLYYEPGPEAGRWHDDFSYVDLEQAYWTIMKTATLDLGFTPGRVLAPGLVPFYDVEEVSAYRALRYVLPGNIGIRTTEWWEHGDYRVSGKPARITAAGLHGYIFYVMHCVAREAIDMFGVVQVQTDGFILPTAQAAAFQEFLVERWGLSSKVKGYGESGLYGLNRYQVGSHRSNHAPVQWTASPVVSFERRGEVVKERVDVSEFDNIMAVDSQWMARERKGLLGLGLAREGLR